MRDAGFDYIPRNPEETTLYHVVAEQLETFLRRQQERDRPVPRFVEEEFRSFLDCGVFARGFVRLKCQSCGHDRLLAFSCKGRIWCPSCGGRRMAETAAHLVDRVFPVVPVRQWVLSLPFALRYQMTYDARLTSTVLNVFIRALFGELRRRASELLNVRGSQCGAVTFVQRFGDALNANPHFHVLAIDGVYAAREDGHPEFHPLPAPEDADVLRLANLVVERVQSLLERQGLAANADGQETDPLSRTDPGMADLVASSVRRRVAVGSNAGRRVVRLGDQIDGDSLDVLQSPLCVMVCGFSVHGNVCVEARDRNRLERLCRYGSRPAVATERLTKLSDGRLLYRLKRPWRDGTSAVIFEPQDFMAKLAVLVPVPRAHLTRYHGVLGPAAAWRSLVVPTEDSNNNDVGLSPVSSTQPTTISSVDAESMPDMPLSSRSRNYTWAELMKRVFLLDVLECERCGGPMKILAAIHSPDVAEKILNCLGLPSRAPPRVPTLSKLTNPNDPF
jgi:Putative transposase/Transposase zinc-binding domain